MELSPADPSVAYFLAGQSLPYDPPDSMRRERITRAEAVAALADPGTTEVGHIQGIMGTMSVTPLAGLPIMRDETGPPEGWVSRFLNGDGDVYGLSFATSYDLGGFSTQFDPDGGVSLFLFELTGSRVDEVEVLPYFETATPGGIRLNAVSGSDGGQYITLLHDGSPELPLGITEMKVWRVDGDFGPVDPPPDPFWMSFVGAREIP